MKIVTEFMFYNPQYYLIIMPSLMSVGLYVGNKLYNKLFSEVNHETNSHFYTQYRLTRRDQ